MLDTLFQDLRYGLRTLAARPGFTAAAVLTLALGIGANTLVFSLISGMYLKPLPYREDAALINIENTYPKIGLAAAGTSIPDYLDRRGQVPALTDSALYSGRNFNLAESGAPQRVQGLRATPSLFSTLGIGAELGRTFSDDEATPGRDKVVVLGNAIWRNQFNAEPSALGRDLRLNGENYRIIGVMPAGFMFPERDTALYVPFAFTPAQQTDTERGTEFSTSIARLAAGATLADVKTQSDLLIQRNLERIGAAGSEGAGFSRFMRDAGFSVSVRPIRTLLAGEHSYMLLLLQLAVALVLLIACANIANLLLVRFSARQKELSVRTALGASRTRITRQLLIEALALALTGAAVGVGFAFVGQRLVGMSGLLPDWVVLELDPRVLGFTLLLTLGAGLVFGLLPAFSATSAQPQQVLRDSGRLGGGGRSAHRLRNALVVTQLALAVALLGSAGLLVRSFNNVLHEDPGFDSHGVLTASISLSSAKYPDAPARAQVMARILEAARNLPDVAAAGLSDARPMAASDAMSGSTYAISGQPADTGAPHALARTVDADYFKAMGIAQLRGRTFTDADWSSPQQVAIIDDLFARKRFPNGDPIGQILDLDRPGVTGKQYTIIGVVGTVKNSDLGEAAGQETYYLNYGQEPTRSVALILRTHGVPVTVTASLRAALLTIDPELPLFEVMTLDARVQQSLVGRRVPMQLIGGFAALALLLAAIGIYGVLAFSVAQRSAEFGVRMAIGASAARIRGQVLGDGLRLVGAGLGLGVLGAFALGFVLRSQLFGVGSIDPPSLIVVVLTLATIALIACWLPARRATRIDPLIALRSE